MNKRHATRCRTAAAAATLSLLCTAATAAGQDWPQWRGPNYDGSTEATGLPTDFDQEKHVKWAAKLPGPGAGTPIIWKDKVFISSIDQGRGQLLALCFETRSGKELWRKNAGSGYRPGGDGNPIQIDDKSNYASPSPVTDGKHVIFFYGNGDLVGYDIDGRELWRKNLQKDYGDFTFQWTFSSSPTLYEGALFMQILQRDRPVHGRGKEGNPSFLLKIDPATGKVIWRKNRPSDARMESLESFATPIPYEGSGRKELIVVGGDVVTGHDPGSGEELWRWGTWNPGHREQWWRHVPSPVIGGGVVVVCAPKRAPIFAAKLGLDGSHEDSGLAWVNRERPVTSDVPTPLYYQGKFFVLSDLRKSLARVDPESGKTEWITSMPGNHLWRASPTGADGNIWCINHGGTVVVVDPEDGDIISEIKMGDSNDNHIRSSIAVAYNHLFIRTNDTLFCVGK